MWYIKYASMKPKVIQKTLSLNSNETYTSFYSDTKDRVLCNSRLKLLFGKFLIKLGIFHIMFPLILNN